MDSADTIKRRLAQLKKMSIQLKQSTQNSNQVDFNIVYGILEATKSSASKNNEINANNNRSQNRSDSPLNKLLEMNAMPVPSFVPQYKSLFPQSNLRDSTKAKGSSMNGHYINIFTSPQNYAQPQSQQDNYFGGQDFERQADEFIGEFGQQTPNLYVPYGSDMFPSPQQNSHHNHHNMRSSNANSHSYYNNQLPQLPQLPQLSQLSQLSSLINNHPSHHHQQHEQQIIKLRQSNQQLQTNISNLRHELVSLRQKLDNVTNQQEWKSGLPYFQLKQKISSFYTRMKINQNDYSKIDYVAYDAELALDRLIIKKSSGMGTIKQLDLAQLCQVHYIDSIVMLLHFGNNANTHHSSSGGINNDDKNNSPSSNHHRRNSSKDFKDQNAKSAKSDKYSNQDNLQNLFIKFKNQQQLHKWDIALYINFKIVESLKKDKLFNMSMTRSRSKSRKRSSEKYANDSHKKSKYANENNSYQDDQQLMKKLVQRRDLYLQTKKMVSQRMIEKVNTKKGIYPSIHQPYPPPNQKKGSFPEYDQVDQYSQTHPFEIRDQSELINNSSVFTAVLKNGESEEQNTRQKNSRSNTSKFKDFQLFNSFNQIPSNGNSSPSETNMTASLINNLNNVDNVFIPSLNIGGNKQPPRELSFNPDNYELSISKKLQEERLKQLNQLSKSEQKQQKYQKNQRIQEIIKKFTEQGYDLTKYSKDGFNPHEKRVFLSQDLTKFCWEQQGGKDQKQIEMKSIKQIQVQKIGEGIRKHIKKPKKDQHCIISYAKDGKVKVIQLGANATVMAQFVDQLIMIREYLKQKSQTQ